MCYKQDYKHDWIFETTSVNNIFQNPFRSMPGIELIIGRYPLFMKIWPLVLRLYRTSFL